MEYIAGSEGYDPVRRAGQTPPPVHKAGAPPRRGPLSSREQKRSTGSERELKSWTMDTPVGCRFAPSRVTGVTGMAKKVKPKPKQSGGPYLAAAVLCETVLMEGGSPSAIRIADTFTLGLTPDAPADVPSKEKPLPLHVKGLLTFKGVNVPGKYKVDLRLVGPSGKKHPIPTTEIVLKPGDVSTHHLRLDIGIMVGKAGLFFLDVYLDGRRVTRMPFQILIERAALPESGAKQSDKGTRHRPPSGRSASS
jgi:hypothetical protein